MGQLPDSLPIFLIPEIPLSLETLWIILPVSATLAVVGLLESMMTASIVNDLTDTTSNKNRECVGQGVANIASGFVGGMAGCAMIGQSVINIKSGGRGRRGQSAETTQRDLGRNVERVVRRLEKPILAVTEGFIEPRRALLAFDGGIVTRRGVEMIAASPLFRGIPVHLLMSGKASADASKQLEWAKKTLESAGFEAPAALIPGDAENIIAKAVREQNIDMLIMGAYSHSPLRSLLFGSKTSDLLRSAKVPTLLLR